MGRDKHPGGGHRGPFPADQGAGAVADDHERFRVERDGKFDGGNDETAGEKGLDRESRGEGFPGIFLFFNHHFGEALAYPFVVGIGQLNACEIIYQCAVDQMMGLGDGHDVSPGMSPSL